MSCLQCHLAMGWRPEGAAIRSHPGIPRYPLFRKSFSLTLSWRNRTGGRCQVADGSCTVSVSVGREFPSDLQEELQSVRLSRT